jgi:anti-sigma factor RsiW
MMHDCADGEMRDLLPGYVNDTLSAAERSAVSAHIQDCADCAAEVELIQAVARAFPAPVVDTAKIVSMLPAAPRRARRGMPMSGAWRFAAAIGGFAIGALSVAALRGAFNKAPSGRQVASAPSPSPRAAAPAAQQPTTATVTRAPLAAHAPVASAKPAPVSISFGGGLGDLTDAQLDMLMGELDTLDALPSAEPETHLSPIIPPDDGGRGAQ